MSAALIPSHLLMPPAVASSIEYEASSMKYRSRGSCCARVVWVTQAASSATAPTSPRPTGPSREGAPMVPPPSRRPRHPLHTRRIAAASASTSTRPRRSL